MTKEDGNGNPVKILLIGDSGTGKTSLSSRLIRNAFDLTNGPTTGIGFNTHDMLVNDKVIRAEIWDAAGREEYRTLVKALFHAAAGIFLVYDISNSDSFKNITRWLKDITELADPKTVVRLVGNKMDLENHRAVPTEKAERFAAANGLSFIETSAMHTSDMLLIFQKLIDEICASMNSSSDNSLFSTCSFISNKMTRDTLVEQSVKDLPCNNTPQQQPEEPFHIVLVDVKKAADYKIHCVSVPLDDDLKYVTISYRWGEMGETLIDTKVGYTAVVTSFHLIDLYDLCGLMIKETDLKDIDYVWVDAICVDQANHERRKATIHQMSTIYEKAKYILAVPDLHAAYLQRTYALYKDALWGSQMYQFDLYHLIHGNTDQLTRIEDETLDEYNVPNDPTLRQLLKTSTDHFTHGFMTYCEHYHQYNPEEILDHMDHEYRHQLEAVAEITQSDDSSTCSNNFGDDEDDDDDPFPDIKRLHHCHQRDCPLALSYANQPKWKQNMIRTNGRYDNRKWQQLVFERSTSIRRSMNFMADLIRDWSSRVWVISEYNIAKKKNNMKYWFTQLFGSRFLGEDIDVTFFKLNFDDSSASAKATFLKNALPSDTWTYRAITNDPVYLTFHQTMLTQLNQQTLFEMILKSRASKNEDRLYAVLPLTEYKSKLTDKAMMDISKMDTLTAVKIKLFEVMNTKDKLNLLFFSGNQMNAATGEILPTFATSELNWISASMEHVILKDMDDSQCNFDLTSMSAITFYHQNNSQRSSSALSGLPYLNLKPMEYFVVAEQDEDNCMGVDPSLWSQLDSEAHRCGEPNIMVCISSFLQKDMIANWDDNDWNYHIIFLMGNFEKNCWVLLQIKGDHPKAPYFSGCIRHTSEDHHDGFNIY